MGGPRSWPWTRSGEIKSFARSGSNDVLFSLLQARDNDVGTFGEVNYFFSDDPDR